MTEPLPRLAVSVCLIGPDGVLLVERAREPFKGRFSLPGGRVEFGETLAEAARREVEEETGLRLPSVAFHTLHEAMGYIFGVLWGTGGLALQWSSLCCDQ